MKLNARIEREEPRLGNRWDLRSVLHFEKKKRRPLTIVVCEVNGLWLQIREYGLHRCAEFSGLRRRVPGLDRDVHFDKKSYRSPPGEWWIVAVPDVAGYLAGVVCLALIDRNVLTAVPNRLSTCLGS